MWGDHLVRSWSKTQGCVTKSSAEAELAGAVKTTSEVLGCSAMVKDLGGVVKQKQ